MKHLGRALGFLKRYWLLAAIAFLSLSIRSSFRMPRTNLGALWPVMRSSLL